MDNCKYTQLLSGKLKPLGYFSDEILILQSDKEFVRYIAHYIVPLIRKSPNFEKYYFQWIKEKDAYIKECYDLRTNIIIEVERAFASLKSKLDSTLLSNPDIKDSVDDIAKTLETKQPIGIPSYIYVAEEQIRCLLSKLLHLDADNIVGDYGVITEVNVTVTNDKTGEWEHHKKNISFFTFSPSIIKLLELKRDFSQNQFAYPWIAWNNLCVLEWCWNTPFSFFDDKTLDWHNDEASNKSQNLLMLHDHWIEINAIKKDEKKERLVPFFEKNKFIGLLKLLLNEIILDQAIESEEIDNFPAEPEIISPYSVEFRLGYTQLFLDVYWFESGSCTTFEVHSFQDGSKRYNFIAAIIKAHVGESISISDSGGNVAKYLQDMNLNNILGQLFFNRINTLTVSMKQTCLMGDDISKSEREELKNCIKKNFKEVPSIY